MQVKKLGYVRSLHFACGSDALAGGKCGWK